MAERKRKSKARLEEHPLVAKVVGDPAARAHATVVSGYVGASGREGYVRLYLTTDLSRHVEVAEDDILHSEELSAEYAPFGATALWVRRGTRLTQTRVDARQVQAEFVGGPLTTELGTMSPQSVAAPMTTWPCRISLAICPTITGKCCDFTDGCSHRGCPPRTAECTQFNCPTPPGYTVKFC
jgi:hypothetical protein